MDYYSYWCSCNNSFCNDVILNLIVIQFTFIVCKCYSEIISVGYRQYKELSLPLFRFLQW